MVRKMLAALAVAAAGFGLAALAPAAAASATPTPTSTTDAVRHPVVLVAGLSGPSAGYEPLASRLRQDGYQVFIYQLPGLGFGDIAASAGNFAGYVATLRASHGFGQVDLVGHSEGGLVSRYYLRNLGGTGSVGRYVSLGTPQYGTSIASIIAFLGLGNCVGIVACNQMAVGSRFLTDLNAGDDTVGAVRYTTVRTLQDELVRPVGNQRSGTDGLPAPRGRAPRTGPRRHRLLHRASRTRRRPDPPQLLRAVEPERRITPAA
jgi:triacylglycerol esterase/lipase EstA (alpha/beta hydrolase family)